MGAPGILGCIVHTFKSKPHLFSFSSKCFLAVFFLQLNRSVGSTYVNIQFSRTHKRAFYTVYGWRMLKSNIDRWTFIAAIFRLLAFGEFLPFFFVSWTHTCALISTPDVFDIYDLNFSSYRDSSVFSVNIIGNHGWGTRWISLKFNWKLFILISLLQYFVWVDNLSVFRVDVAVVAYTYT